MLLSEIEIEDRFLGLLPARSDEDREALAADIAEHGWREPLVVWRNHGILLDGHNRFDVWQLSGTDEDDGPEIVEYKFDDFLEAKAWVLENQIKCRRNCSDNERARLIGELHNTRKQQHGGDRKSNRHSDGLISDDAVSAADEVAAETGVSSRTVERDAAYAAAVESIAGNAEIPAADITGSKVPKKRIVAIGKLDPWNQKKAFFEARDGKPAAEPTPAAELKPMFDGLKREVPDDLRDIFAGRKDAAEILAAISALKKRIEAYAGKPFAVRTDIENSLALLKQLRANVRQSQPHTECARCQREVAEDCKLCMGRHWVDEVTARQFTDKEVAWLNSH